MGLYESSQKVLVGAFDYNSCFDGSSYSVYSRFSCCSIYLLDFLKFMSFLRISKVAFFNIIFLLLFLSIVDFFLGYWRNNFFGSNEYLQIPNLTRNKTYKYDVKNLYSSKKQINNIYKRDEFGYRSKDLTSTRPIVLTIGGSTTDQHYVTEGKTFQDILDLKVKKYDFGIKKLFSWSKIMIL